MFVDSEMDDPAVYIMLLNYIDVMMHTLYSEVVHVSGSKIWLYFSGPALAVH